MTTSLMRLPSAGDERVRDEEGVEARGSSHLDRDPAVTLPDKHEAEDDRVRLLAALIVLRCS